MLIPEKGVVMENCTYTFEAKISLGDGETIFAGIYHDLSEDDLNEIKQILFDFSMSRPSKRRD